MGERVFAMARLLHNLIVICADYWMEDRGEGKEDEFRSAVE